MASNFGLIAGPLVLVTAVVGVSLPGCESAEQISETKQSKINAPGDSHQKGLDAISREDYDAAFSEWVPLAASGDSKAQYYLGVMYSQVVEEKDYKEARRLFKQAADSGLMGAQYQLAVMYTEGLGGPTNYEEAIRLYKAVSKYQQPDAWYELGKLYLRGRGITKDEITANEFLKKAAEFGHPLAQNNLGVSYQQGRGIEQDWLQAYKWFRIAYNLSTGELPVKKFLVWGTPEWDKHINSILENFNVVSTKLSVIERQKAERLARKWLQGYMNDMKKN